MSDKLEQLLLKREMIQLGGGEDKIARQNAKGKLSARQRLDLLFDEGTFVELDAFMNHRCTNFGMDEVKTPAEGVVSGYGRIDGRLVYAYSQDFTVLGGSLGEMHAKKICKVQELAVKTGAPLVGLHDSGGARIQEGVDALAGYGDIFFRNTMASGVVPQICAIMGPCAGGAVYSPALMDFIFMVENTSQMFITGPQVIKSVTGEEVTAEALGGAATHNAISGVAHFQSKNDEECLMDIRRLISFLPSNNIEDTPVIPGNDDPNRFVDLNDIIPDNPQKAYDMLDVIRTIADDEDVFEVSKHFALNIITAFIRLNGITVGVIANQPQVMAGCLDMSASDKAARFIRICDSFNVPLVTFVDVPGFLPGTEQELGGIIRHGAKILYAYSEAAVPKLTVITRKAYGGAYIAMCSKHLGADMVYAWPAAEIAVMGPDGAANIIFKHEIDQADDPVSTRNQKVEEYTEEFATPYKAAERGYVDDIIEPSHTRIRLIEALDTFSSKREYRAPKKHGNIPL